MASPLVGTVSRMQGGGFYRSGAEDDLARLMTMLMLGKPPEIAELGTKHPSDPAYMTGGGEAALSRQQKSPYEPTLQPGEKRSLQDVMAMLANVVLASGVENIPGIGPRGQTRKAPARERLFHGGAAGIKEIRPGRFGGVFLTPNEAVATGYAKQRYNKGQSAAVYTAEPSLKNPMVYDAKSGAANQYDLIARAKSLGHDGLIIKNTFDSAGSTKTKPDSPLVDVYVSFAPVRVDPSGANVLRPDPYAGLR